jgi:mRNA interferase RelE/StbE
VRYSRTFLKELARLPEGVRSRIEAVVFGEAIKADPYLGGKVKKMVGYREYYKIRFGNYRVGLRIDRDLKVVEFLRVLHRKDIYREFP